MHKWKKVRKGVDTRPDQGWDTEESAKQPLTSLRASQPYRRLFVAEGNHWIDAHRSPSGDVAGGQRHKQE
jgi:hypothetical protein